MYDNTIVQPTITYIPQDQFSLHTLVVFAQHVTADIFSFGFLGFLYVIASIILVGLITLILYVLVRMYEIRMEDKKKKSPVVLPTSMPLSAQNTIAGIANLPVGNQTWQHIREKLLSDNTSEWKLAIIEGDIYMDKVFDDKGFHGDTTGDKLKQITPDKLPSIQLAWEVHTIRNRIAHQGAAFVLTMPEARRLLSYYEIIFTDLGVI